MTEASADSRQLALIAWGLQGRPYECVSCSAVAYWPLHHFIFRSQMGNDLPENLLPLCSGPGSNGCHEKVHGEVWQISRTENRVYTLENGVVISETPWPPLPDAEKQVGTLVHAAKEALDTLESYPSHLLATELSATAVEVRSIRDASDSLLAHIAWERLQRIPRGQREQAAKDVAAEWSSLGKSVSESTVRSLARQWELRAEIGAETWDGTPPSIRAYAASRPTREERADAVSMWSEREPNVGVREFIEGRRAASAIICGTCRGRGTVPCPTCQSA